MEQKRRREGGRKRIVIKFIKKDVNNSKGYNKATVIIKKNNIIKTEKRQMVDDRKSSTMNSIFLGSTLEKPNVELIINAVATILHSQMLEVSQYVRSHHAINILELFLITLLFVGSKSRKDNPLGE